MTVSIRWVRKRPPLRLTLDPLTHERLADLAERWQTSVSGVVDRLAREEAERRQK